MSLAQSDPEDPIIHYLGCLSKCCCQYTSQLFRKNFEYSCDQVTFRMAVSKKLP